jgi:hypothetical protein
VNQPVKDRSHWTIRKFHSHEELRCQQVKDWQALSGAKRRGSLSWITGLE